MHAPVSTLRVTVPTEWIDVNGHMNATHYGLVIYEAHVTFTRQLGLGEDYVQRTGCGKAVLASHMVYEREVALGDELEVRSWLLAVDAKRLHFFHELHNLGKGCRAATAEQVDIHIDLALRQSSALPEVLFAALQQRVLANLDAGPPPGVGSPIRPPINHWLNT